MAYCDHFRIEHPDFMRLSVEQLYDWIAYCQETGPFGHNRDDIFHAQAACLFANANSSKDTFPFGVDDFLIYTKTEDPTEDELESKLNLLFGKPK